MNNVYVHERMCPGQHKFCYGLSAIYLVALVWLDKVQNEPQSQQFVAGQHC